MSGNEKDCSNNNAVVDVSGELQRKREEAMKQQIEQRKKALVELIIRQTDYDEEKANLKLVQWNNNYLNVIKEYMNPNFQKKEEEENSTTKNQMIYGEIRHFMDGVNRHALFRKRQKEQMEKKREAYLAYLQHQAAQKKETNQIEEHGPGTLCRDDKGKLQFKYDSDADSKSSDNTDSKISQGTSDDSLDK